MLFFLLIFATIPKGIFLFSYLVGLKINDKDCTGTVVDYKMIATSAACFPDLPSEMHEEHETEFDSTEPAEVESSSQEENSPAGEEGSRSKRQNESTGESIEYDIDSLKAFKITYGIYSLGITDVRKIVMHELPTKIDKLKYDLTIIKLKDRLPDDKVIVMPMEEDDPWPFNGTEPCTLKSIKNIVDSENTTALNETSTGESQELEQSAKIFGIGECGCATSGIPEGIACVEVIATEETCYGEEGGPLICNDKLAGIALERYKCNPLDGDACNIKTDVVDLYVGMKSHSNWMQTLEDDGDEGSDVDVGGKNTNVKGSNANVVKEKLIYPFLIIQIIHVFVLN